MSFNYPIVRKVGFPQDRELICIGYAAEIQKNPCMLTSLKTVLSWNTNI